MDKVHVETYYASLNKKNEELCGDKVKILRNEKSCIVVLSDGLGSGVKANVLATLTSEIIATMLNEGAELSDAIETIINTLPVCSESKVAYSTFTVCQVSSEIGYVPEILIFSLPSHTSLKLSFLSSCLSLR